MNSRLLFVSLLLVLALATSGTAQVTGDYRSAVNNGNWGTAATWETFDGSNWVAASATPGASNNVTVRNGYNVILDASGKNCANLTIEPGATFKTGTVLPTSNIRYVRVNGDTALINGTFGDSAGTGDAISLEAAGDSNTVTITGTGVFAPARVRVNSSASACTVIFDMDAKFMYTGSSGTGGIALYPQTDNNTFTVNAGKTLTFVDLASIAIGSSNNAVAAFNLQIHVHGTINMPGAGSQLTLRAGSGKAAALNISNGGSVVVGKNLYVSTVADGGTTTIQDDGSLTVGILADFSHPGFVMSGAGTFTLSPGATILIGHPQGITSSGATGQVQTAVRNFSPEASYTYIGTAAQVTGDALPATVYRLTINDSLGVTLSHTTAVSGIVTLTGGALITGSDTLIVIDTGWVARNSGFVEGNLQKRVLTGTNVAATFELGTGTTYSPVTVTFDNVSTEGTLVAAAKAGKHPRIGGAIDPMHAVNRYWTLSIGSIGFDRFGAIFNFAATDIDAGADTAAFIVGRENAGVWSFPQPANRTATSTSAWFLTEAGDFVVGQPLPASRLVQSNGTGGGVWNDMMTWLWGAVPRPADSVAIIGGDSVTVTAGDSCAALGVLAGGKLALDSSLTATVVGVEGLVVKNQGGGLTASGIVAFGNGGYYLHNQAGGSIPTALWGAGSTCEIRAALSSAPQNGNQNFYNVVWNCPDQTANLNMGWKNVTIGGNITVLATGTGRWQLTAPAADSTALVTIMGDILQSGGAFTSNGTSNANTMIVIHQYGNINVTGGNFAVSRGSQGGGTGTTNWYLHAGNFSMTNATSQNSNSTGARFVFDKQGTQTLTLSNVTFAGGGLPIRVDSGATLNTGISVLRGSGPFTLNNGATLGTGNPGGLDSTVQTTGTKTLNAGARFLFNGTSPQITGVSLPAEVAGVTVDNDSSVTLSGAVTVDSSLSVLHGHLFLNGKVVTLGPAGLLHETAGHTVAGDSGVIMTTRTLTAPSATGDIGGLGIKIGSSADLGSTVIARGHAVQSIGATAAIRRFFDIRPSNNAGLNATLVFAFDASELNGAPASALELYRSPDSGITWAATGGVVDTAMRTITLTGVNALSRWTAGAVFDGIADEGTVPIVFSLEQNYPNPFNPSTTILFSVEKAGQATIELFNILGQKVAMLFDGVVEPGRMHTVRFDGGHLPSGTYFYRLQSGGKTELKKLLLLK